MRLTHNAVLRVSVASAAVMATLVLAVGIAVAEPGFSSIQVMPVPVGIKAADVGFSAISCASTTSCTAVGHAGDAASVATEVSGTWGTSQVVAPPAGAVSGELDAISCPSSGDCTADGDYVTPAGGTSPFVVSESSGSWGASVSAMPPSDTITGAYEDARLTGVWCASAGNCTAIGSYVATGSTAFAMEATETLGIWSALAPLPPITGGKLPNSRASLVCTSMGSCTAVMDSYAWTETAGAWGTPTQFAPPLDPYWSFTALGIACPSATTCIATGFVTDGNGHSRPGYGAGSVTETSGSWGAPFLKFGYATALDSISCQPTMCLAVGVDASDNDFDLFDKPVAATWSDGTWSSSGIEQLNPAGPHENNGSSLDAVACRPTQCLAIGQAGVYTTGGGPVSLYPYSTDLTPVRPIVAPSAPTGVYAAPVLNGAQVWWQPPLDDGGAPTASYTATATPGKKSCTAAYSMCEITGLVNGRQYVVTVTDDNGSFSSPPSRSNRFFAGVVPNTPSRLRAKPSGSTAVISWHPSETPPGETVLRSSCRLKWREGSAPCARPRRGLARCRDWPTATPTRSWSLRST